MSVIRCRLCNRILTSQDSIKHCYGPLCFFKMFGYRPQKPHLHIQNYNGYVKAKEIPPLFYDEEDDKGMGTITVVNRSGLTDKAALALAADYYNHRDDAELIEVINSLKVKIFKKGHKFVILDIEKGVNE